MCTGESRLTQNCYQEKGTPKKTHFRFCPPQSLISVHTLSTHYPHTFVCAVSQPYLPFLNNWLISIARQKHQDKVLVIAEDYATLYKVNEWWPGHAVLVPPAPDAQTAHKFGFFNFTSRRPRHLLQILELGYNVMYNDVDMVWLADQFPYFEGKHDVYFTDDMTPVKPLKHSHDLPPPGKKGRAYI
ncbi:hypothetical protein ACFX13_041391 [Malus domestica]|uniref:Nucleotide-diphospho-sugar transferase domain-containing protein n=1 Tax=Malus domestica TaxID=3750 RepID=A0A498JJV8_MALDO|nr:hypothetical protein DVH24_014177 [Malus domestica]